jgi:hypothetical protein
MGSWKETDSGEAGVGRAHGRTALGMADIFCQVAECLPGVRSGPEFRHTDPVSEGLFSPKYQRVKSSTTQGNRICREPWVSIR